MDKTIKQLSRLWWGQDFPRYRPHDSTYLAYLPSEIPPLKKTFRGDFKWLGDEKKQSSKIKASPWSARMLQWQKKFKIAFPEDFTNLVQIHNWQNLIALSPTKCFVPDDLELTPFLSGYILELYRDQEGITWFLYFESSSAKCTFSIVLSSQYSLAELLRCPAEALPKYVEISEDSCESFFYRTHLENLAWYSFHRDLFNIELSGEWAKPVEAYLDFYNEEKWQKSLSEKSEKELLRTWNEADEAAVIKYRKFPESFLKQIITAENGKYISHHQALSENFMEANADRLDWHILCIHQKMSEDFIRAHYSRATSNAPDWKMISGHQRLSEKFITEFETKIDWSAILQNQPLSSGFLEKIAEKIDGDTLSLAKNLPEAFIRKHADILNWEELSSKQTLTEALMADFEEKIDWDAVSHYQKLSAGFAKKYRHKVNWALISAYQKITPKFFDECKYYLEFEKLGENIFLSAKERVAYAEKWKEVYANVSEAEIARHPENFDFTNLCRYKKLSVSFIEKFPDRIHWFMLSKSPFLTPDFIRKFSEKVDWEQISRFQSLSVELINEFEDKINWTRLSQNDRIEEKILEKFSDKINWNAVSMNRKLSEDFMRRFSNLLNWPSISRYQTLSENFIREFQDKLQWNTVFQYQKLSAKFKKEFAHKVTAPSA